MADGSRTRCDARSLVVSPSRRRSGRRLSRRRLRPARPEGEGLGIHRPLRPRARLPTSRLRAERRDRGRPTGATVLPLAEALESHAGADRGDGSARWSRPRTPSSPATRRAGATASSSTSPRGRQGSSEPIRVELPLDEDGAAVAWRTLVVLEEGAEAEVWEHCGLARRRDRRAAQLGGRAARRPGGDAALRQHPGHLRAGLDLRHPARPGRARRPPRVDGARLRLGARQGADGDQPRRRRAPRRG